MIVVTTPTGNIGSKLAELLLERGEAVRVIARDPSKLAPAVQEGAETIVGSHADPAVLDAALAGADAIFLIVPPDGQAESVEGHYVEYGRQARAAIERNGVGHAVMISTLGSGNDRAGHLSAAIAAEAEVGQSGAAVRAIAAPFFMENLLNQAQAIQGGVIGLPSDADRILPMVATADLAAVASDLLSDRSWDGVGRVPVSSPDALTPVEVVATVGQALGRDLAFQQIPTDSYAEMLRGYGMGAAWADGIAEMAVAQNAGFYDSEIDEARGKTPTTLAQWTETVLKPIVDPTDA
jgi:uncharacterized protein YbjT (DUF2867 family)